MFPEQSYVGWTRELQKLVSEKTIDQGQRLATWLVVGNAGALVVSFNGVIQGSTCSLATMQGAANSFAIGLGLAFGAAVTSYFGSISNLLFMTKVNSLAERMFINKFHERELEAAKADVSHFETEYAKAGEALAGTTHRTLWVAPSIALALSLGSAAAFGAGVLGPVSQSTAAFTSCAAKSMTKAPSAPLPAPAQKASQNAPGTPTVK